MTLGGEFTATVAPDDEGKFNYTDYERSALQLIRLGVTINVRPVEGIAFITELRAEGATDGGPWNGIPVAAYLRVRPWRKHAFDIQAGRIPPVFGVGGRRLYSSDNVLIGYPLAWQYLTVMRPDAVPANADELIYARSYGWQPSYSVGSDNYAKGVPLATAFRYDTGVEARVGEETRPLSVAAAFTAGTVSSPGARSSNGGPQFSTRVAVRPTTGLILGGSYANGTFIANTVQETLPAGVAERALRAADLRRRRGVLEGLLAVSIGARLRAVDAAGPRRSANRQPALGIGPLGRGTVSPDAGRDARRAPRSPLVQRPERARTSRFRGTRR